MQTEKIALLLIVCLVLISVSYAQIDDGNFYITCDKEDYRIIGGYSSAYCNVTKMNLSNSPENVSIDFVFENNTYVSVSDIYYYNDTGEINTSYWVLLNQSANESYDIHMNRGHGLRVPTDITFNVTKQYLVKIYNSIYSTSDKFWIVVNSTYTGLTELDPNVNLEPSCTSSTTEINCTGSITGNYISAGSKNVNILSATINGNGLTTGDYGKFEITTTGNIKIWNTTITANGANGIADPYTAAGQGYLTLTANNVTVNISDLTCNGGAGHTVSCNAISGTNANINFNINNFYFINSNLTSNGGNGGYAGYDACPAGSGGSVYMYSTTNYTNISGSKIIMTSGQGNYGHDYSGNSGGNSGGVTVYLNSTNNLGETKNSQITLTAVRGGIMSTVNGAPSDIIFTLNNFIHNYLNLTLDGGEGVCTTGTCSKPGDIYYTHNIYIGYSTTQSNNNYYIDSGDWVHSGASTCPAASGVYIIENYSTSNLTINNMYYSYNGGVKGSCGSGNAAGNTSYISYGDKVVYNNSNFVSIETTSIHKFDVSFKRWDMLTNYNATINTVSTINLSSTSSPKLAWTGSYLQNKTNVYCNNNNIQIYNTTSLPSNLNITTSCGTPSYVSYNTYYDIDLTPPKINQINTNGSINLTSNNGQVCGWYNKTSNIVYSPNGTENNKIDLSAYTQFTSGLYFNGTHWYVTNYDNYTIFLFNSSFGYVKNWTLPLKPGSIDYNGSNFIIAHYTNSIVGIYDTNFNQLSNFSATRVVGLAFGKNNDILTSGYNIDMYRRYSNGTIICTMTKPSLYIYGAAYTSDTPDYMYFTNEVAGQHTIIRYYYDNCSLVDSTTLDIISPFADNDLKIYGNYIYRAQGNTADKYYIWNYTFGYWNYTQGSTLGGPSTNTTPTIQFTTDENANCRFSNLAYNYTNMNSSMDCSTTGGTNQVCTLYSSLTQYATDYIYPLYIACCDTSGNCQDAITSDPAYTFNYTLQGTGVSSPVITQVQSISAITLTAFSTTNVRTLFNVTDANGYADLNDSKAWCALSKTSEATRNSTSCTAQNQAGNDLVYNCSLSMYFYDASGTWNVSCYAEDNGGLNAINTSQTATVNTLNYLTDDKTYLNWTSVTAGINDKEADNSLIFTNGGNQNYNTLTITSRNNTYLTNIIPHTSFSVSNQTGQTTGQTYLSSSGVVWSGGYLQKCTSPCSTNATENAYFYLDAPTGIVSGTYTSISSWDVAFS